MGCARLRRGGGLIGLSHRDLEAAPQALIRGIVTGPLVPTLGTSGPLRIVRFRDKFNPTTRERGDNTLLGQNTFCCQIPAYGSQSCALSLLRFGHSVQAYGAATGWKVCVRRVRPHVSPRRCDF